MDSRLPAPLVEQIISEAKKTFVGGHALSEALKAKAAKDADLRMKLVESHFIHYRDNRFQGNANYIPGTSFVASAGPKAIQNMRVFLQDTLFNTRFPVKQVVNLCNHVAYQSHDHQDFYDYCLKERDERFGPYVASIKRIKGEVSQSISGHQSYPHGAVHTQLLVRSFPENANESPHTLNVITLELTDANALDLSKPLKEGSDLMETLWQIYQTSLKEPVLIHCAAGVGRTGHLMLTLEILKHHKTIFGSNDPQAGAAEIHRILDRMRLPRPALVTTEDQFTCAIRNADILYHYALEKKYIQANAPQPSSLGIFATRPFTEIFTARETVGRQPQA
jgi:protein tyrosine phosphatase